MLSGKHQAHLGVISSFNLQLLNSLVLVDLTNHLRWISNDNHIR